MSPERTAPVSPSATLRLVTHVTAPGCNPSQGAPPASAMPQDPPARKRPHGSALRQQPPRSILTDYQRSGVSWQAVDREAVFTACDALARAGVEFTDALALMDLHAWIDRQQVKPYRYYAKRWNWGEKRVYNFMLALGIYGTRGASGEQKGASGEQTGAKQAGNRTEISDRGASGEQKGASGEQYPTSLSLPGEKDTLLVAVATERRAVIEPKKGTPKVSTPKVAASDVDRLYAIYPRKRKPQDAKKAIAKALKVHGFEKLETATTAYAAAVAGWPDEDRRFVPYPASWFNAGGYDEDPAEWTRGNAAELRPWDDDAKRRASEDKAWLATIRVDKHATSGAMLWCDRASGPAVRDGYATVYPRPTVVEEVAA